MPQVERDRTSTSEATVSRVKTRRLLAIAAVLEKVAIFVAMAVLTYMLIAVDTRVNIPTNPFKTVSVHKAEG